ncbi:MAG: hypothetical protein LUF04_14960 [Bacteroides sp.]|nr:hypothetical protein [Bacteroides sp.]
MKVQIIAEVTAKDGSTSLKTLETNVVKNAKATADAASDNVTLFSRSKTTAVFGKADAAPVAYEVTDIILATADEAAGYYANSYDDMYGYLTDKDINNFTVYNMGSLKLDDRLMTLVSGKGKTVTFQNAIEIAAESKSFVTLSNVVFAGGATIAKGNINFSGNVTLPAKTTLTIKKDATAKIGNDATSTTFVGTVNNNGTLQLAGSTAAKVANDEKKAIVEVVENQTIGTGGIVTFNTPAILKVAKGKTLTIAADKGQIIGVGQKVENNGIITATAAANFTNKGVIDNYGTIDAVTNKTVDANADGTKKAAALINNYGVITSVVNTGDATNGNALIVVKSNLADVTATGTGDIDNTVGGFVSTESNTVYAKYSGDQNKMLGNVKGCKKVILTDGIWTDPALAEGIETLDLGGVTLTKSSATDTEPIILGMKTVVMKNSSSSKALTFSGATSLDVTNSTFAGDVVLSEVATKIDLNYTKFNGKLTASLATAPLNLRGVIFGGVVIASAVTDINILGPAEDDDVESAETTIGAVVTINQEAESTLDVEKGAILMVKTGASIGTDKKTTVTNAGIVRNYGTISGSNPNNDKPSAAGSGSSWLGDGVKNTTATL